MSTVTNALYPPSTLHPPQVLAMTTRTSTQAAPKVFYANNIPVEVTKKQVKRFNLRIKSDGRVTLSCPKRVTLAEVQAFLDAYTDWIITHVNQVTAQKNQRLVEDLRDGGCVQLWGESYKLKVCPDQTLMQKRSVLTTVRMTRAANSKQHITGCFYKDEGQKLVIIGMPSVFWEMLPQEQEELLGNAVEHLKTEELTLALPRIQERAEARTGLKAVQWSVRTMRSRWGSCTPAKRTVRLSSRLASYPEDCAVYVAVHELCHLLEPQHNAHFHALVEAGCPNWRELRAHLDAGRTS